jgi:hypothetical protein
LLSSEVTPSSTLDACMIFETLINVRLIIDQIPASSSTLQAADSCLSPSILKMRVDNVRWFSSCDSQSLLHYLQHLCAHN